MTCFHPLDGIRFYDRTLNKWRSTLKHREMMHVMQSESDIYWSKQKIPCGQCIGCRVERSRQWAMRCVCEMVMHKEASFLTLTFDPLYLPKNNSISKEFISDWLKKFRERVRYHFNKEIRFYACGEYGDKLGRPHYHAIIFGFDFPDKTLWSRKAGQLLYVSQFLKKAWIYGWHTIGQVTFDSAQYVAQYVHKKITSKNSKVVADHYGDREPEFHHMSRRPGIGKEWFDHFYSDCYPKDLFIWKGKTMRPPKYFDYLLKKFHRPLYDQLKADREEKQLNSPWSTLSEEELEKELRRKEAFLKRAHSNHHRYLDEELANA